MTAKTRLTKAQWFAEMDRLCKKRTGCTWADLCGDEDPWIGWYDHSDEPNEFVTFWIQKYDLDEFNERGLPI